MGCKRVGRRVKEKDTETRKISRGLVCFFFLGKTDGRVGWLAASGVFGPAGKCEARSASRAGCAGVRVCGMRGERGELGTGGRLDFDSVTEMQAEEIRN